MEKKYKKQRRNITIKITAVLLAVWLLVSVAFCVTITTTTKDKIITQEQDSFYTLVRNINSNSASSADTYADFIKQPSTYIIDEEKPKLSCGADGYLDNTVQILVLSENEDGTYSEFVNTDKTVKANGFGYTYTDDYGNELKSICSGILTYESFIQSITQEQLDSISKYLYTKKDKDGNYYELICKEFYFDEESSEIFPKTVDVVLTHEDNTWYAQDEVIETYELNPKFTDKLTLYTSSYDDRNVIPGQFVLGTFKSDNLIESYTTEEGYTYLDEGYTKVSPFTYVYKNAADLQTEEIVNDDLAIKDSESSDVYYYKVYAEENPTLVINYAKLINVLDSCKNTLILGISALFLFFLIIGVILTIMMWKVMKTQMSEEQKRRETTNALAHDIKTPLFIIGGYAQSLKENINTDKREHYADRIIERTEEVNELVHKMLDFSRLDSTENNLNFEDFDVTAYVKELIERFEDSDSSKRFILNTNAECTPFADKELMRRVVSNLVDNAVRYSEENTDIVIDINEKSFSISNVCSNITDEDIKHLTQPYYRVEKNRESKGNGLGLSIVKSILDIHGYKLDIKLNDQIITFSVLF